jgi:hypothetical protein
VPRDADANEMEAKRRELETGLNRLTAEADEEVNGESLFVDRGKR